MQIVNFLITESYFHMVVVLYGFVYVNMKPTVPLSFYLSAPLMHRLPQTLSALHIYVFSCSKTLQMRKDLLNNCLVGSGVLGAAKTATCAGQGVLQNQG